MSLQFILGSSGSGKSYTLYQEVIDKSIEHLDSNYLIIVPEQFTMQTQKDIVSMHPDNGIMNIDVLSFMRLAFRVFDELGGHDQLVLEDTGKSMVLRKVVQQKKEELVLFQSNIKKTGFISEIKSMISEIYQYSIEPDQLENMIAKTSDKPMLQNKLRDLLTVYSGFEEYLKDRYITAEEILDILAGVVEGSKLINNSTICLDGFTGFTPSQYKLIAKLLRYAKKVIVTVTIDPREETSQIDEEFKLFHLSKKTILKLKDIGREEGISVDKDIYAGNKDVPYRYKDSPPLAFLEHNLFRYPSGQYMEEQDDISIHITTDPKEEACFVTRSILRLIREENYRYRDIAVVTGDIENYGRILDKEFQLANIPSFIDYKRDILSNPLVEFIRSVIELIEKDYSYESMFRYLKCGMVSISNEDIDILENYVIALGIRGYKRWRKEWTRTYRSKTGIHLSKINELRVKISEELEELRIVLRSKDSNVLDYTTGLYEFMVRQGVEEKVRDYSNMFLDEGELLKSKEFRQVYGIVIELFDKMVELLGDETLSLKEYSEIITSGLQEAKVGLIPPGIDQVVVGDIERTRLKDIKALFFVGVNDGIVPKVSSGGGILSDMERQLLAEHNVELAPTRKQSSYTEQFYIYLNLTKPQNRLYISLSKVSREGKTIRPSYLISRLRNMYPMLEVVHEGSNPSDINYILGTKQGMNYLSEGVRNYNGMDMDPCWKELFSWYMRHEDKKEQLHHIIQGAFYNNEELGLTKAVSHALYGNEMSNSVTRLERYASCAYAHFINYGLELIERQEYQIAVPDLGNIFHNAIELFSKRLNNSEYNWHTITDELREQYVSESVVEATLEYGNTILQSSNRNEYMIRRIERITKRTIWALCEQIRQGVFQPDSFELQFSRMDNLESTNMPLSNSERMNLRGRIDRLDTYDDGEHIYVKVIDYKSGNKTLDILSLYYGLQLQLVVYLGAAMEITEKKNPGRTVIPAGIFYYHIDDPIVDKVDAKDTSNEILKELKMSGIANKDISIAGLMDSNLINKDGVGRPSVKSTVVPVETNKDGYPTKRSSVASKEQFKALTSYARDKMTNLGREIIEGCTKINPYKLKDITACDYCQYGGICGFDTKMPGNTYRNLSVFDKEEVWVMLIKDREDITGKEVD